MLNSRKWGICSLSAGTLQTQSENSDETIWTDILFLKHWLCFWHGVSDSSRGWKGEDECGRASRADHKYTAHDKKPYRHRFTSCRFLKNAWWLLKILNCRRPPDYTEFDRALKVNWKKTYRLWAVELEGGQHCSQDLGNLGYYSI